MENEKGGTQQVTEEYNYIQIKLPRRLHSEIKSYAAIRGMTLKDYLVAILWDRVRIEDKYR